ncbi:MAG: efflux RND transporter periplasmic adaptor subunit [bacterium]
MKKVLIIGGVILVLALVVFGALRGNRTKEHEVEVARIERKELVATVTASGTIDPRRQVDVSANTMGRVTTLAVAEGDTVNEDDFLLEIDPTEFRSAVRALEAATHSTEADLELAIASAEKAELDLRRADELYKQGIQSEEQLQAARTGAKVERARVASSRSRLIQAEANLDKARYDLEKVTVTAPMSGVITRLNVEEGENAIMGTLNNPGTVLLVIADLSVMEAVVRVDETEVVKVALGQPAEVSIDAFPDTTFTGRVIEIGNSPIFSSAGASQQAVDFEVKVVLEDRIPHIRPGLSAEAEIEIARRTEALAVPLGAVTVRKWPPQESSSRGRGRRSDNRTETAETAETDNSANAGPEEDQEDKEGVFVVSDGKVTFRPIRIGITGEDDFEVLSGLTEDETVVTGPFRVLRELEDGDAVKSNQDEDNRRGRRRERTRDREAEADESPASDGETDGGE